MVFVDISYFYNDTADAEALLLQHEPNLGYLDFLPEDWDVHVVKFLNTDRALQQGRTKFHFFKGDASKFWIPLKANRFIALMKPDVVLFHGLIFPQQLLALKAMLPKKTKILVQHHAEKPGRGLMLSLQRLADKYVYRYLFTAKELAASWQDAGVISNSSKVVEVMEGSTGMWKIFRPGARDILGFRDEPVFLWVGRLDANKDPLTVLTAFEQYLQYNPRAKLFMFYHDGVLELAVRQMIVQSKLLNAAVELKGKVERKALVTWYSAADFYISASHSEGSGYALIEAMNCGCIPVVTCIPSFKKITAEGKAGLLYKAGDVKMLFDTLMGLDRIDQEQMRQAVLMQFEKELSFKAIAGKVASIAKL